MRTDLHRFPHRISMPLRFGDTDQQGHVNNAVFATLFESGRVDFVYDKARRMPPQGTSFVIVEITIRFIAELHFPATPMILSGVSRMGRSSVGLEQVIVDGDAVVASASSVIVLLDNATRKSCPLPDSAREHLARLSLGDGTLEA